MEQHSGGFTRHLQETMNQLTNVPFVRKCGFLRFEEVCEDDLEAVMHEDADLANVFGTIILNLVGLRIKRHAYMFWGWPHRLLRILLPSSQGHDALVRELKHDWRIFKH